MNCQQVEEEASRHERKCELCGRDKMERRRMSLIELSSVFGQRSCFDGKIRDRKLYENLLYC